MSSWGIDGDAASPCQPLFGAHDCDCGSRVWLLLLFAELTDACRLGFESHEIAELVRELLCVGDLLTTVRTRVWPSVGASKGVELCIS